MSNRYTTLRPTTYDDIPLFQPNYEGLDAILGQQETKYNNTQATIDALMPDALSQFQPQADAYYDNWRSQIDELPDIYKNNFKEGKSKMNELLRNAKREIQDPNSEYSHFKNTKASYIAGVKRIEEFHKKDPIKYNKQWAMNQMNSQLKGAKWDDFYKDGKVVKNFSDPELTPYVDIQKDVIDAISKIKLNQDTEFSSWINPGFIQKIKTQQITPELIEEVTNQLLDNPKYKDQLKIEKWFTTKDIDFGAKEKDYLLNINKTKDDLFKKLDGADKMSKDELKRYQKQLGITVDGIYGSETKKAINEFKISYEQNIKDQINDPNFSSNFQNEITKNLARDPYIETAKGMFARKLIDKSLIVDQPYLTKLKLNQSRSNTQSMIRAMEKFIPEKEVDVLVTPYKGYTANSFNKEKTTASDNLKNANSNLNNLVTNPNIQKLFRKKMPGATGLLPGVTIPMGSEEIAENIKIATEIDNSNLPIEEKVANYSRLTGIPLDQAGIMYHEINSNGLAQTFGEAYNSVNEAKNTVQTIDDVELSVKETYFKNEGKQKMASIKKDYNLGDLNDKEVIQLLQESQKYMDIKVDENGNVMGGIPIQNKKGTVTGKKYVKISDKYKNNIGKIIGSASAGYGSRTVNVSTNKSNLLMSEIEGEIEKAVKINPEYSKSLRSHDIRGGKNTQLNHLMKEIDGRLNDPAGITGLIEELSGRADFQFDAADGSGSTSFHGLKNLQSDLVTKPYGNVIVVRGVNKEGKSFTQEFKVPDTYKPRLDKAIMEMGIDGYQDKDPVAYEIAANTWASGNGANKDLALFKAIKPTSKISSQNVNIYIDPSQPNAKVEYKTYSTPLKYSAAPGGVNYNIHLVKGSTGNPSYVATRKVQDANGNIKEMLIPIKGHKGYAHPNIEDLTTEINKIEMPRYFEKEVKLEKLPNGQVIPEAVVPSLIGFNNVSNINIE